MLPHQTRALAQRLLTYEGASDQTSGPAEPVAFRVCEKLRRPLSALAGASASRLLLSRALTLAKAEVPTLGPVQIAADGSLRRSGGPNSQIDNAQVREGGVILIARLLELLLSSIGEGATLRLVTSEILPDLNSHPMSDISPGFAGFEAILNEADQLQGVSTRLAAMADQHPLVTQELLTVAGSVDGTANLLNILVAVKSPRPN